MPSKLSSSWKIIFCKDKILNSCPILNRIYSKRTIWHKPRLLVFASFFFIVSTIFLSSMPNCCAKDLMNIEMGMPVSEKSFLGLNSKTWCLVYASTSRNWRNNKRCFVIASSFPKRCLLIFLSLHNSKNLDLHRDASFVYLRGRSGCRQFLNILAKFFATIANNQRNFFL